MAKIAVIGSINMDVVVRVKDFPEPGETIRGEEVNFFPGGKGANQAVAAARLGGEITFAGQVGTDPFGAKLKSVLLDEKIDCSHLYECVGSSGIAIITVNSNGENHIVLSAGANGKLTTELINQSTGFLENSDFVLFQLEIQTGVVWELIKEAKKLGCRVLLNPAPAALIPGDIYPLLDVLVLNESEADFITGGASDPIEFLGKLVNGLVVETLGTNGLEALTGSKERIKLDAFKVKSVDSTAAGDAFVGALALKLAESNRVKESLAFASAAAALSVTRNGAQPSLPNRKETERFLADNTDC